MQTEVILGSPKHIRLTPGTHSFVDYHHSSALSKEANQEKHKQPGKAVNHLNPSFFCIDIFLSLLKNIRPLTGSPFISVRLASRAFCHFDNPALLLTLALPPLDAVCSNSRLSETRPLYNVTVIYLRAGPTSHPGDWSIDVMALLSREDKHRH